MIADFTWPVVQAGWLELDGTDINTTTYSALYSVMTVQQTGTRVSASAIITSLPSTSNLRVGYYVFGTGIASGTTIISIDSATQITLSVVASSTGTATVIASPWLLNTGTIRLPDTTTSGRYRRSRTSSTAVGQTQADQNQAHTHSLSVSGTTNSIGDHVHSNTLNDPGHAHGTSGVHMDVSNAVLGSGLQVADIGGSATGPGFGTFAATNTTGMSINNALAGAHSHTVTSTGTSGSVGGTEARPLSLIVMTCVKT